MRGVEARATATLVRAAAAGQQQAWDALVDRYMRLVRGIVRLQGVPASDVPDVVQIVWMRLARSIMTLNDPEHVGSWLATTARNEGLRAGRRAIHAEWDADVADVADTGPSPSTLALLGERDRILWQSFEKLRSKCRSLLTLLADSGERSYAEAAAALDMRIGSIGPTRQRCLDELRGLLEERGITAPGEGVQSE